jgi:hypothetical protein
LHDALEAGGYLAGRLAIEREHRARARFEENKKDDYQKECARESWAFVLGMKRSSMTDSFAKLDFNSQAMATQDAESLLRGVKLDHDPSHNSSAPDKPQSN